MRTVTIPLEEYDAMKERDLFYKEEIKEIYNNQIVMIYFQKNFVREQPTIEMVINNSKAVSKLDKSTFIKELEFSLGNNKKFNHLKIEVFEK